MNVVGTPTATPPALDRHFRTDHLLSDLKGRSVRGGAVTLSSQAVKFTLQLGSTMVLARLLTPPDFGLIAMVAAFAGFVGLFKDLGLSMATVQRAEITHEQVSTLFWINVALSVVLMGIAAALAPAVAWFYGEPRLTWVMLAVAGTFIFGGLSAQHTALLRRQMRFTALAIIEVGSMAAGIAVAILMAWRGFGYWSLVAMGAASAGATMLLCWILSGWWPGLPQRHSGVRPMLAFGTYLTGSTVLNYVVGNADKALLGWYWGATPLGLYSKAYALLLLPMQQVNTPLASVAMPALSRAQSDPMLFRQYYCRAIMMIAYLTAPFLALSCVLSYEIILLLLGQQWTESAAVFQVFAYGFLILPVTATTGWLHVSMGTTARLLRWSILNTAIALLAFLAGLPWGAVGTAMGLVGWLYVTFIPAFMVATYDSPVRLRDVAAAVWKPYVATSFILCIASFARHSVHGNGVWFTVAVVACVAAIAGAVGYLTWPPLRADLRSIARLRQHLRASVEQQ